MTQGARARKMHQLQQQIEAMHPIAIEMVSDAFTPANRRRFLEGVPFWMIFELSDALNKLCAEDRKKLAAKKATTKATKVKSRRSTNQN
jgi:hypothetical protein